MASGYVIAAFLETAGLIGLVFALFKIQTERRAKAAELRSFLHSGQSASTSPHDRDRHHWTAFRTRVVTVPYAVGTGHTGLTRNSAARSALRRAIARSGQRFHADTIAPISAG